MKKFYLITILIASIQFDINAAAAAAAGPELSQDAINQIFRKAVSEGSYSVIQELQHAIEIQKLQQATNPYNDSSKRLTAKKKAEFANELTLIDDLFIAQEMEEHSKLSPSKNVIEEEFSNAVQKGNFDAVKMITDFHYAAHDLIIEQLNRLNRMQNLSKAQEAIKKLLENSSKLN